MSLGKRIGKQIICSRTALCYWPRSGRGSRTVWYIPVVKYDGSSFRVSDRSDRYSSCQLAVPISYFGQELLSSLRFLYRTKGVVRYELKRRSLETTSRADFMNRVRSFLSACRPVRNRIVCVGGHMRSMQRSVHRIIHPSMSGLAVQAWVIPQEDNRTHETVRTKFCTAPSLGVLLTR